MGKKRIRKTYTSKGVHSNVSASTLSLVNRGKSHIEKSLNKIRAWREGKNPWITVPNSDKRATNRLFIKVRANALYGDPRGRDYNNSDKADVE